nr:unnamed protein product [Digitaria exilis]
MLLFEPTKYWSTVLSHPTSSCECGTRCTFSLPATGAVAVALDAAANAIASVAAGAKSATTSSISSGSGGAMACERAEGPVVVSGTAGVSAMVLPQKQQQ